MPLAGKTVKLKRTSPRKPRIKKTTLTDSNGCYLFTDLEDGTYRISVKRLRCGGRQIVEISGGSKVNDVNFRCR